jgi:hypothetical protein
MEQAGGATHGGTACVGCPASSSERPRLPAANAWLSRSPAASARASMSPNAATARALSPAARATWPSLPSTLISVRVSPTRRARVRLSSK